MTSDWARDYFERSYAQRWGLPSVSDRVRQQVDGLCRLLPVDPRSSIVDIACGHGRHALAFAERGHPVIGVDFAAALLARARQLSGDLGVGAWWVRGDMRQLPLQSGSAGAAIVTDSFGLFDADEENEAVLREAARIIEPDGGIAMKVVNGAPILAAFRETDREERDGAVVEISRSLSHDAYNMQLQRTVIRHGVRAAAELRVRASEPHLSMDIEHSQGEDRSYCFGMVNGGVLTVRFTYRNEMIRIYGAGYWRKGQAIYERKNKVHR